MSHLRPGEGATAEMFYDSTTISDSICVHAVFIPLRY